jgi:hypothetical protein
MPPTGSTFVDWQQPEAERRLLMDEDFGWCEPPARSRRSLASQPIRALRGAPVLVESDPIRQDSWAAPTESHSHVDAMMHDWGETHGAAVGFDLDDDAGYGYAPVRESPSSAFDLSDPGSVPDAGSRRRTVLITGHGDDRYMPVPRRRSPSSELRFHERAGFSPDRTGLWAVLLGIALLVGCVAH